MSEPRFFVRGSRVADARESFVVQAGRTSRFPQNPSTGPLRGQGAFAP